LGRALTRHVVLKSTNSFSQKIKEFLFSENKRILIETDIRATERERGNV
jgi:hypothetical protein